MRSLVFSKRRPAPVRREHRGIEASVLARKVGVAPDDLARLGEGGGHAWADHPRRLAALSVTLDDLAG